MILRNIFRQPNRMYEVRHDRGFTRVWTVPSQCWRYFRLAEPMGPSEGYIERTVVASLLAQNRGRVMRLDHSTTLAAWHRQH